MNRQCLALGPSLSVGLAGAARADLVPLPPTFLRASRSRLAARAPTTARAPAQNATCTTSANSSGYGCLKCVPEWQLEGLRQRIRARTARAARSAAAWRALSALAGRRFVRCGHDAHAAQAPPLADSLRENSTRWVHGYRLFCSPRSSRCPSTCAACAARSGQRSERARSPTPSCVRILPSRGSRQLHTKDRCSRAVRLVG